MTDSDNASIAGVRVLIVEDDSLLAFTLKHMLEDLDCVPVGPAGRVKEAFAIVEAEKFDIAVLDVNLAGESIYPLAKHLYDGKQPFIFSTGMPLHAANGLFRDVPVLAKPFSMSDLQRSIADALGR